MPFGVARPRSICICRLWINKRDRVSCVTDYSGFGFGNGQAEIDLQLQGHFKSISLSLPGGVRIQLSGLDVGLAY